MGKHKYALLRYTVLDECFKSTTRKYFKTDLLESINEELRKRFDRDASISERTLDNDIKDMQDLIPLESTVLIEKKKEGRNVYFRYSDPNFSIFNALISKEEKEKIKTAFAVLSRFAGAPHFEWVQEIIARVRDKFELDDSLKEVIAYDSNLNLKGLDFINPIYEAIISETVLEIEYKDFKENPTYTFSFHPHFLKEYNNRWFAFGHGVSDLYKYEPVWVTALDRIVSISKINEKYISSDIDWNDYFTDIIGITQPKGVQKTKVKLAICKDQAQYVITKPIHGSQKQIEWIGDELIIELNIIPNFELERKILSYGERIKVIEPVNLKDRIKKRIETALTHYV